MFFWQVKVEGYRMENWLVIPKMSMTDPEYMLIRPKGTDPLNVRGQKLDYVKDTNDYIGGVTLKYAYFYV